MSLMVVMLVMLLMMVIVVHEGDLLRCETSNNDIASAGGPENMWSRCVNACINIYICIAVIVYVNSMVVVHENILGSIHEHILGSDHALLRPAVAAGMLVLSSLSLSTVMPKSAPSMSFAAQSGWMSTMVRWCIYYPKETALCGAVVQRGCRT